MNLFKKYMDKFSDNPEGYTTMNTDEERKLFYKYLEKSSQYLEFGSGGSTFDALKKTKGTVYSIEGSFKWTKDMKSYVFIGKNIKKKRLFLCYVDIGKTGDWSVPKNEKKKENFPLYSNIVKHVGERNLSSIDLILIDGRFRVACALNAILNCNKDTIILIHDFWNREHYHILLDYLEVIDRAGSLGVFKIKNDINEDEVSQFYEQYKYNFN